MILIDAEAVPGHTGVFATIVSLSYVDLQSPVVVEDVRVSIQGAGAAVFEPADRRADRQTDRQAL